MTDHYRKMIGGPFAIERLVYERWGGGPQDWGTIERVLQRVERREGWKRQQLGEPHSSANHVAYEWHDLYGASVGWSLHCGAISAVSTRRPEFGLPPEFHLTSEGRLYEALSADGFFILPDADWLLAP